MIVWGLLCWMILWPCNDRGRSGQAQAGLVQAKLILQCWIGLFLSPTDNVSKRSCLVNLISHHIPEMNDAFIRSSASGGKLHVVPVMTRGEGGCIVSVAGTV